MTLISKFQITPLISNLTKTVSKIRVSLMSAINCSVKRKLKKDESNVNLTDDTTEVSVVFFLDPFINTKLQIHSNQLVFFS
jgi:hypothetical protein